MPFASGGSLSLAVDGGLKKERNAVRKFRTVETFAKLTKLDCDGYEKPARNKLYPLTGSIGMARIMDTFIDISQIGGAEKTFTDEITFTTTVGGGVRPTLVLNPIVGEFRPVLADLDVDTGEPTFTRCSSLSRSRKRI